MRKPAFAYAKTKTQISCTVFHYIDYAIPILPKSKIPSLEPFSLAVQPSLCQTWSEIQKTDFSQRGSFYSNSTFTI